MPAEQKYWFKAKKYGWGWGLPQTRQGWAVLVIFVAIFVWTLTRLFEMSGDFSASFGDIAPYLAVIFADALFLMYFCFKHGEPPRWRWGDDDKK